MPPNNYQHAMFGMGTIGQISIETTIIKIFRETLRATLLSEQK